MREWGTRGNAGFLCLGILCLFFGLVRISPAVAAEQPPYEFDATLSLTGGCGTSKADPIPDPGCPEKKPPKGFIKPTAIAIDSSGDEYVASYGAEEGKQGRIDVFSPEGVFITEVEDEFGPRSVAIDSKGNLYVFNQRPGNSSQVVRYGPTVYKPAEEKIEYGSPAKVLIDELGPTVDGIAIDADEHVFIDWEASIKIFSSAEEENKLLETITNKKLYSSTFVALDKKRRRLYVSSCPNQVIAECWVLVFNADAPHELLEEVKGPNAEEIFASHKGWISIAVNEATGDFFVGDLEQSKNVYQFNEDYELVSTLEQNPSLFEGGEPLQIAVSNAKSAFNHEYLFVPSLRNRALAYHPPEAVEPEIEALFATGISQTEAELQAQIDPGGSTTTYRLEYLSQQEYEEAGNSFAGASVAGEGTIQADEQEAEVSAALSGLQPGVAYRLRVFAENEKGSDEAQATFTTYADAPITNECPEAIRTAYSALLPDCRAYELVTPADTNGQAPSGITSAGDNFPSVKASPTGNVVSFLTRGGSLPGLGGAGGLNGDQYRTTRTASGWSTELAGPEGTEASSPDPGSTSPDQEFSFWEAFGEGSALVEGKETRYVRYPDGHSALVGRGSLGTDPRARGKLITEGGTHIVFETHPVNASEEPIQLEPEAPPSGTVAVYDRTADEVTHVVSLLPGDVTPNAGEDASYLGASPEGNGIAFEITKGENAGKLYLRLDNNATYELGKGFTFAGVAEGGSRIFYLEGGNLIAFDAESEEEIPFTSTGNAIPVNVSTDGTRAYFVSTTAIEGSGENPNGASAQAGEENLYLSEEGQVRFVATVTKRDVMGKSVGVFNVDGLGLWTSALQGRLVADPSRTSPDGSVLIFSSRANLDGYAHEGVPELYRYDSTEGRLHCISCIPTKTPAGEGATLQSTFSATEFAAPLTATGFVPNLRADGKRAIFQSTEALVSRDNDGVQDVYEWEEQGVGSCAKPGGCIYLISSGHSAKDNYLYAVSQSGDDAFFTTSDVLVDGDNDTVSIYDARVNGGFSEEICQGGCCEGDCRSELTKPPSLGSPVTTVVGPSGNVKTKRCPKGKHKVIRSGKEVCVKNKKHHRKKHHAKKQGRAGK